MFSNCHFAKKIMFHVVVSAASAATMSFCIILAEFSTNLVFVFT